jgi:DNA primase
MYYSQEVLNDVRMGNDIVDVIGSFVKLKRSGSSYVGLCPFHKEKTPSFNVNRESQFYHCFGCGASGNVFGFLMQHQNYSFPDAVKYLADRINYTLPEAEYSADYESKKRLRQTLYDIHKVAARFYYERLNSPDGKNTVRYLDERRITPQARIKYGLGYAPISTGALYERLVSEGYDNEVILQSGLVNKRDDGSYRDKFFNRLMFPIINVYGNIIGFGGRVIGEGEPKYLNSPETEIFNKSKNLYSLNLARLSKMRELILVEGYMDVISIYQAGFHNVVAALGTAFNENHAKTLKAYADSVILLFDSDAAGVKAVLRAIPVLNNAGIKVKVLQVTDAKDPDEYIKKFGASAFGRLLATARSQYSFLIDNAAEKYDLTNNDDKISYANEVAKILSEIDNAIEADLYIKDAAELTGISQEAIKSEIAVIRGKAVTETVVKQKFTAVSGNKNNKGVDDARKSLICIMTGHPTLCEKLKGLLRAEEFCDDFYIKMVDAIYKAMDSGVPVIAANITSVFDTVELQQRAAQLFITQMSFKSNDELYKAASDQLRIVKESYIDDKIKGCNDPVAIKDLFKEKRNINSLIKI